MDYIPTIFEQIVSDYLKNSLRSYKDYELKWKQRGYNEQDFKSYLADVEYAASFLSKPDMPVVKACAEAKEYVKDRTDIVTFALTNREKQLVLRAEDKGRIKNGDIITYEGYSKSIKGFDYMNVPKQVDAFVIFSGHPGAGASAVRSWYNDYKKTGTPKKLIFLGLHDNQGNTNFSDNGLEFNVRSEVEMYVRFFKACGVPKKYIKECLVTPKDISTADNIELLAEIRNRFFDKDKEINFAMFGYPSYQKRIASEFSYGFQQLADNQKVASTNFYIPDVPVSDKEEERYLSYDNLNGIAQDIIIGNCMAHPYRISAGGRFDSKLGAYPLEFKPLLSLSLVYSYPNVANELAGTDLNVAYVMKVMRAMQHKVKGWEDPKRVDQSIRRRAKELRKQLLQDGLVNTDILSRKGKTNLGTFQAFFKNNGR